jgi:hypothetical protein
VSRPVRPAKVARFRAFGELRWSWFVARKTRRGFDTRHVSFVSRGEFRVYLDEPYHCYGGTHRYRRAGLLLSLRVRAGGALCAASDAATKARLRARRAWWSACYLILDPIRAWRSRRKFDREFREIMREVGQ